MELQSKLNVIKSIIDGSFCPKIFSIYHTDRAGRVYIREEYQTDSSKSIRSPSRAFPYSKFKHGFTKKYKKQLLSKMVSELFE